MELPPVARPRRERGSTLPDSLARSTGMDAAQKSQDFIDDLRLSSGRVDDHRVGSGLLQGIELTGHQIGPEKVILPTG